MKPLANLVALREPDPARRAGWISRLVSDGYREVAACETWVIGEAPLLGRVDNHRVPLPERRLAFAEGRESIVRNPNDLRAWRVAATELSRGAQGLAAWPGDFTAIHVAPGGELTVARSVSGRVPVYVLHDETQTIVATRLSAVARYAARPLVVDPWPTALRMETLVPDGSRTVLAGVTLLPPGSCASARNAFSPVPYWDPREIEVRPPSKTAQLEHAERLRDALVRALAHELDENTLLLLSGGFDSSCLAVMAHRQGRPYSTLTFLPPEPDDQLRERRWLDRVRRHTRATVRRQWGYPLTPAGRLALLDAAPRSVVPHRHAALALLARLQADSGVTTLMGGEGADELFGSITVHEDWMATLRPLDLVRLPRAIPFVARYARGYARHLLGRAVAEPPMPVPRQMCLLFREPLREHYLEWRRQLALSLLDANAPRPLLELRYRALSNGMTAHWEVCSGLGVARSFPFATRELIELAFEAHPVEGLGWGGKRLSRLGLRALVPRDIRSRRDKGVSRHGPLPSVRWDEPTPSELARVIRSRADASQAEMLGIWEALRLRALLNIVGALRIERQCHDHS